MREMGKMLFGIAVLAFFLLLYVHGQVCLLQVSYLIDDRSEKLSRYSEDYRRLKFEVEQLKAPRLLEEKMKSLSLDLTLPQEIRVIKTAPMATNLENVSLKPAASDRFFDFVGRIVNIAQAKTDNS